MRKPVVLFVALALAGAAYVTLLPPPALGSAALEVATDGPEPVRGAVHVHSRRSDGTGTVEEIAAAAARAGLGFVIVTDHGDATRRPDPPAYTRGVLVIDAVEISTNAGHVVALALPQAPYALAGEPREVVDDIVRLGGFAIAAHPGSAKPELRWGDWTADLAGVEWLNADSEWRDESRWALLRGLLTYPVRRAETVAALFNRPAEVLSRWDSLTLTRRAIGLAAPDAHARVGMRSLGEPYKTVARTCTFPRYESMFRTISLVLPGLDLTREAAADAVSVLAAIEAGRFYSRIDGLVNAGALTFTATSGANRAGSGEVLPLDGPVALHVAIAAPQDSIATLFRDGVPIRQSDGDAFDEDVSAEPAVYRVEVRVPAGPGVPPVPWIVSNPIYVGRAAPGAPNGAAVVSHPPQQVEWLYDNAAASAAKVERSDLSQAALDVIAAVGGRQLLFRYGLGGRLSEGPYAALSFPTTRAAQFDRVTFTARADHPMRLAVQLRVPGGPLGERWQRSVYLDDTARLVTIGFSELVPVGTARRGPPPLAEIDSLLFVVDTVNTKPGGSGTVWLDEIRFER